VILADFTLVSIKFNLNRYIVGPQFSPNFHLFAQFLVNFGVWITIFLIEDD